MWWVVLSPSIRLGIMNLHAALAFAGYVADWTLGIDVVNCGRISR